MITPSISESQVLTVLRTFILSIVDCEVIKTQTNRVPMPKGAFIAMTPGAAVPLSTNVAGYTQSTKSVVRPTKLPVQIDSYGADAQERAQAISTLFRDEYGVQAFKASNLDIAPLYASDAQQMPLISGEDQYVDRWTFNVEIQYNPLLVMPQESATVLDIDLIDVEVEYPTG